MNKVVYNACFGGFGLSEVAQNWMREHGHPEYAERYPKIERHNPLLVQCVEELGALVNTEYSDLCVEDIEGNKYWIENYDGLETVYTPENTEWIVIEYTL